MHLVNVCGNDCFRSTRPFICSYNFRMADSVDSIVEHGTSDELVDPYCDPCFRKGSVGRVAGYCPKCVEFYCQACLDIHRRFSTLARHVILYGKDMPSSQADKPVKYELCETHDGEPRDRFCSDHCGIICGLCIIRQHKNCNVKSVSDVYKTLNISTEEQLFNQGAKSLLEYAKTVKQSMADDSNRLEEEKENIVEDAKKHRDKIIQQANKSFQDFHVELTQLHKERKDILARNNAGTDHIISDIEFLLHTKPKYLGVRQFLELCASADRLQLCADKLKSLDVTISRLQSTFNMHILPLSELQCKSGELSLEKSTLHLDTPFPELYNPYKSQSEAGNQTARSSSAVAGHPSLPMKLTKKDKINVNLKDDTRDCFITGLDTTVNGTVILTDHDNCKRKVVSPEGELLSALTLPVNPNGVAIINKTDAAVTMANKQIGIIDTADSGHLSLKRIITMEQYLWGITATKNNLVVTCDTSTKGPRSVQMIDMRGKVLWTTTTDTEGKNLFECARFLTTCSGDDCDTVIVTDWVKQTITVLDAATGKVVKVCDVKGKNPNGVTVDDNGNVFVCYDSGKITVWSKSMEVERCLVSGSAGLEFPCAMTYNSRRRELLLSSRFEDTEYRDFIHRYSISND